MGPMGPRGLGPIFFLTYICLIHLFVYFVHLFNICLIVLPIELPIELPIVLPIELSIVLPIALPIALPTWQMVSSTMMPLLERLVRIGRLTRVAKMQLRCGLWIAAAPSTMSKVDPCASTFPSLIRASLAHPLLASRKQTGCKLAKMRAFQHMLAVSK